MIRRALVVAGGRSPEPAAALLDLGRWARAERDVEVTAILLDRGPGAAGWAEVADVRQPPVPVATARRASRVLAQPVWGRVAERAWLRRHLAEADGFDVVVAASTEALAALDHLPPAAPPIVALLPLLDEARARLHDDPSDLLRRLDAAALVVVPAAAVADWAVRPLADGGLGLSPGRVRHHPGPVAPPPRHPRARPDGVALVAGCGPLGWSAGADLFVAVAAAVGPTVDGRPVRWTWVGDPDPDGTGADVLAEVARRDLGERVGVVPAGVGRPEALAAADLCAITTRIDPYPLAAVEAALAGTPVVGFRPGTALLAEAGHDDRRVDHLDVRALAEQVTDLLTDTDRGRLLAGDQARAAAGATTPIMAAALWDDVEAAVAAAGEGAR